MSDDSAPFFRSSFPNLESVGFRSAVWKLGVPERASELRPMHATLLAALASAARVPKIGVTLLGEDDETPAEHRTYAQWDRDARRLAEALADGGVGVAKGERVILVLPTGFDFLVAFFAVLHVGAIPVPTYPPALMEKAEVALERIQQIASRAGASHCLTDATLYPLLGGLASSVGTLRGIHIVSRLVRRRAARAAPTFAPASASDTAFLQFTSGSTGSPKGVVLTHGNVCANLHAIGQAMKINHRDKVVSWLPLYHDMGLIGGLLFPLFFHIPLVLMAPTTFLGQPVRWLRAIHAHKGTMSASPNFGYDLAAKRVRPRDREGLDLSSWRLALNGAEPVSQRTIAEFQAAYGPHGFRSTAMYPVYGLAESCVGVTFPRPESEVKHVVVDRAALAEGRVLPSSGDGSTAIACVGDPLPAHEVLVVDAEGAPVAPSTVGHIVVRGPSVMAGYYDDEAATARVLRGGWLWTGDLGYRNDEGLYVTGRAKDLIIVRGRNFYAEDIEQVAERVPGARAGACAAFAVYDDEAARELAVLVCETRVVRDAERKALADAVVATVIAQTGLTLDEVVLVPTGALPKTSSGKRQRSLTRTRYLDGTLARPAARASTLRLVRVFARSGAGFLSLLGRRLGIGRREPE